MNRERILECVHYRGILFWFLKRYLNVVWLRQSQPYYANPTYKYVYKIRMRTNTHSHSHTVTLIHTVFSRDFLSLPFPICLCCVALLSISRAWIRYSTAGSSSLANQQTSLDARAYCIGVSVSVLCSSAYAFMYCLYSFLQNGTESSRFSFKSERVCMYEC